MTQQARFGIAAACAAAMTVMSVAAQTPSTAPRAGAAQPPQQTVATPRTADGHPDLSGMWAGGGGGGAARPDEKGNLTGPIGFQLTHGAGNKSAASFRSVYIRPIRK